MIGQKNKFQVNDQFEEIIIKLNKEKVRPFANAKFDIFLYKTITLNITSFWKSKKILILATSVTQHGNYYLVVDIHSDINFMVKLIQETVIFKIQLSYNIIEDSESINLFIKRSAIINTRILFKNYKKYV